ncbi:MAG: SRPBCC family protein [Candidatus Promineofilum sp.]|nr:SRPBCC family protein [Promineifilum sp.]
MALDVVRQIGATTRAISSRVVAGQLARVITASRVYDTGQADLWDALTNIERIPRWFLPVSGDLRLGGHYQFEGNAGGEIVACDPPEQFKVTWGMHGQVSWLNISLAEQGDGRTMLRLEHIAHVPDEMWNQYGPGAVGVGWDGGLLGLDLYLSGDSSVTPETAAEWMTGEEGKDFNRQSSEAWAQAAITAGTDPDAARAAAANTTAFYLGEEG